MTEYSLKARTRRGFLLPLALAVLVVVGLSAVLSYDSVSAMRDEQMLQDARFVLLLASHEAGEGDDLGPVERWDNSLSIQGTGEGRQFQVWSAQGEITRSNGMPRFAARHPPGFHDDYAAGRKWRVYVLEREANGSGVELAEPYAARWEIVSIIVLSLALPLILLSGAVVAIGNFEVRRALRPLERLSEELDRRDGRDFSLVDGKDIPQEVRPLLVALNRLFDRLGQAFLREREFSDNAAHELRTPLAALKTKAQVVERKLRTQPELSGDLSQLVQAVDRTARVIDQLLAFSRLGALETPALLDLSATVEAVARDLAPAILAKGIDFEVDIAPAVTLPGSETGFRHAVRNILDNALKFTPAGGQITLALRRGPGTVDISVADTGPGIPAGDEARIFERFVRGEGPAAGSGLGLALVARVASHHGGTAKAERLDPNGLRVTLSVPVSNEGMRT